MKKVLLIMMATAILAACSSSDEEPTSSELTDVTLTFSPYQVDAITRAATSIAGIVTRLDVWIYESGSECAAVHQSADDVQFGSISLTLDKTKTYTLYAVGHKAAGPATLADGIISFPDDKTTHSMFFTTTFSPSVTTSLSCLMQRIVAQFRIETTDAVPADMKKIQITINDIFDRWSVTAGGTNQVDRTYTINITSTAQDGTVAINVFPIVTDAQTLHTVTVTGLDADDAVTLTPRTFADVPLRNGYRTTYRGALRDANTTATFTVDDWNDLETVNF
jgi:hypothetical protein